MAKKKSQSLTKTSDPNPNGRAIQVAPYFRRWLTPWATPSTLTGSQWRETVRNQPTAIVSRQTLISSLINLEWALVPKDPDKKGRLKADIQEYTDVLANADGDFDHHIELMLQDMLDLPFGGAAEPIREGDSPEGRLLAIEHIDGATLYPTLNDDYPVVQYVPEARSPQTVYFPEHAIARMFVNPRPEILYKGWGMAPPQCVYLAILMMYRGDRFYANLLIDTPEAGILDLGDMEEDTAHAWLEGFQSLFSSADPFKVPVLYEHTTPAKWIPFGRSPNELMMDSVGEKYVKLVCAGYGLRTSDLGLESVAGEKTLAGVVRGERQSRRTGYAVVRTKTQNYWNHLLDGTDLQFRWIDNDSEESGVRYKSLLTAGQALQSAVVAGLITREEGRKQLVADGLFTIDLDPEKMPPEPDPLAGLVGPGGKAGGGIPKPKKTKEKVSVANGGRGENPIKRFFNRRNREDVVLRATPELPMSRAEVEEAMTDWAQRNVAEITSNVSEGHLRGLIRPATEQVFPAVVRIFASADQETIENVWLPQMDAVTWGDDEFLADFDDSDVMVLRAEEDYIGEEIDRLLDEEDWWKIDDSEESREELTAILRAAFVRGLFQSGLEMMQFLFDVGAIGSPDIIGIDFNLQNPVTLRNIEESAATLVRRLDDGTKFYMRRAIFSGVREGLSSPTIADAMKRGIGLDELMRDHGFMEQTLDTVRASLQGVATWRMNSIVNTEINRAENSAKLEQYTKNGLKTKAWKHLGKRGVSAKGNVHPCKHCEENEKLGFVALSFLYPTVFKDQPSPYPPAHPGECHCVIRFNEDELLSKVQNGQFKPWAGE